MSHNILIHGAWEESRAWDDVSPILQQNGHTVTAIDLPGHGENKQRIAQVTMAGYIYSLRSRIPHYRTYNSFVFNRLKRTKCAFFSVKSIQAVVDVITQLDHQVILVGHSMTGAVISQVAIPS